MESNHQVPLIHSQRVWPDCIGGNSTKRPVPSRSFLWEVARKFRSSLTLFKAASAPGPHRQRIGQPLDAFYGGQECEATLKFIEQDAC
jgi:uncharacterized protein (DUF1810 family)